MIRLRLTQFGGRGGKGGGAGGSGKGKANSGVDTGPGHHGSAGGRLIDTHGSNLLSKSTKGEKVKAINPREDYTIADERNGKESNERNVTGQSLKKMMDNNEIKYDKNRDTWVDKNGKRHVIRKRAR